jgi:hypothetical protein
VRPAFLDELPIPVRWAFVGAVISAIVGGVAGLVIGLIGYPPTAPFAAVELGLPSAMFGGLVGLLSGGAVAAVRRLPHSTAIER